MPKGNTPKKISKAQMKNLKAQEQEEESNSEDDYEECGESLGSQDSHTSDEEEGGKSLKRKLTTLQALNKVCFSFHSHYLSNSITFLQANKKITFPKEKKPSNPPSKKKKTEHKEETTKNHVWTSAETALLVTLHNGCSPCQSESGNN